MQPAHSPEEIDWPTTLRFSRRLGEAVRDAEYAMAIEGPRPRPSLGRALMRWVVRMHAQVVALVVRPH